MFDYRRILLWLIVLLAPGGFLLLPVLIANMRRGRDRKRESQAPSQLPPLAA